VTHGGVLVVKTPGWTDNFGTEHSPELIKAKGFKANIRDDTGDVLGIVSNEYEVVDNRDAPGRPNGACADVGTNTSYATPMRSKCLATASRCW
jgi:hypothetical protein